MDQRANNLEGYFDVREYNAKKERKEWKIKEEGQTIEFSQIFSTENLPKELSEFAKLFTRKDSTQACVVRFKISSRCKWFGKNAEGKFTEMAKPTNEELDGTRYQVAINYRTLHGDASKKEASGYWANGICILGTASNSMFDDLNDTAAPEAQTNDNMPF